MTSPGSPETPPLRSEWNSVFLYPVLTRELPPDRLDVGQSLEGVVVEVVLLFEHVDLSHCPLVSPVPRGTRLLLLLYTGFKTVYITLCPFP